MKKNRLSFWLLLPCFVGMMLLCGKNMLEHPLTASLKTSSQPSFVQKWYTALQMQLGNRQRNGVYIGETALYALPQPLSETALFFVSEISISAVSRRCFFLQRCLSGWYALCGAKTCHQAVLQRH